jgi:hypothetical protein
MKIKYVRRVRFACWITKATDTLEPDRTQMTIKYVRRVSFACWITKATDMVGPDRT